METRQMKKLEVGDYVKNLTKRQFDNLKKNITREELPYTFVKGQTDTLYMHMNGYIDFPGFNYKPKTELTYRQFLGRAKNTFGA